VVFVLTLLLSIAPHAPVMPPCTQEWRALDGITLGSRADTIALRDSLEARPDECGPMVAAYLRAFLTMPGSDHWEERLRAQQALESVIQRSGLGPRLILAFGYLRYQQGMHTAARRLLERGRATLSEVEPPARARERAAAAYLSGRLAQSDWRDWRSFGVLSPTSEGRWACEDYLQDLIAMSGMGSGALAAAARNERPSPVDANVACAEQFESIMDDYFHLNAHLKRDARRDLETHFREAIALEPASWLPYRALASELVFEADWPTLDRLAREACRALPEDYRPLVLLAVATVRMGNLADGAHLFDSALALMPDTVQWWYRDPESVLSLAETRALAEQPAAVRARWADAFWRSRRVSYLADENDRLLEHYARLSEADELFGIPSLHVAGWNTAPGSAWIRYGRPLKIRDLPLENGRASFWSYGPDPDLVFTRMLTFEEYRLHQHVGAQVDLLHERMPTRFRPPGVDTVVGLEHQVARFRGDSGRADVIVVAGPSDRFAHVSDGEAGVTLLNDAFTRVAQWRSRSVPPHGVAITIAGVRPRGAHSLVVELLDRERRVLAQARDTFALVAAMPGPALSDVLVVRQVEGRDGSTRRGDLTIAHLFGRTVAEGQPVGLVWEVYGLTAGTGRAWRYRITLEVRDAEGRALLARLLRGAGRAGTTLAYERVAVPQAERTVEWVNLDGSWKAGAYDVVLRVEDLVGGGMATATTRLRVESRPSEH